MKMDSGKYLYHINGNTILYAENGQHKPVCIAKGCSSIEVSPTLIGLNFCGEHFGQFFDSDESLEYEHPKDAINAEEWEWEEK